MALMAAPAFAAQTHPYTGTSFGPDGAAGSESFTAVQGVAVDQASGDVYVFDGGAGKLFKFDSSGEPADFSSLGTNAIGGIAGAGSGENEIAVAPAGAPAGTAGDIYVANASTVRVYAASGVPLGALGEGETCGVAVNPAGHVFIGSYSETVREYTPSANPPTNADLTTTGSAPGVGLCNVAADGLGNVYASNYTGTAIAKLEGIADPSPTPIPGAGAATLAVDPVSNDLYADNAGSISQYDSDGNLLGTFGSEQLSGSYGIGVNGGSDEAYAGTGSGKVAIFGPPVVVPGVSTEPATAVTGTTATLNGAVNPDGLAVSDCQFEYGTEAGVYTKTQPCEGAIPVDDNEHSVSAALIGLSRGTTYHFRIVATNANGTARSDDEVFTTNIPAATGGATEVTGTKATLQGIVNPEGVAVSQCFFEYGTGFGYGKTVPCVGAIPTDEGGHPVTAALAHLTPHANYHFRLVIERGTDMFPGADESFQTSPTVGTGAVSSIAPPSASVEGTVNPEGIPYTECIFEYGFTAKYGSSVPCAESTAAIGTGTSPVSVHASLTDLTFGATYHYRLVATNADGVSKGEDQTFQTPGAAIEAGYATSVGLTEATLQTTINPGGSATTYRIEYGTDTSYGSSSPEAPIGADNVGQSVSTTLEGLTSATTYHWRVVATNSVGVSEGPDHTFSTYAPSSPPQTDCPNQAFRTGAGADLPDCRAYEQATPSDKHGGNVQGSVLVVQASAKGDRITFADAGGLRTTGGTSKPVVYLASRGAGTWSSNGLLPLLEPGESADPLGWDDEIGTSVSGTPSGLVLFDTATGSSRLAIDGAGQSSLAAFAADTGHFIFESASTLVSGAAANKGNLYDFDHGALTLAGRIPAGSATSCDDVDGPACVPSPEGSLAGGGGYPQDTISSDGSKVFFTTGSGQLYVREDGTKTTQISASQASAPDPNGQKPATFMAATPSGSKVLFASCEKLTDDSTAVSTAADTCFDSSQGQDLYSYDTASGDLTDLTVDSNTDDPQRAGVIGVLGSSADGSYVYFAASGALAPGASPERCAGDNFIGTCNLYLLHSGTTTFIARLDKHGDENDWLAKYSPAGAGQLREARVADNGTLVFGSTQSLTDYDTTPTCSAGEGCHEFFRYDPAKTELTCLSCVVTGVPPTESARLESPRNAYDASPNNDLLTRNISADGRRVFFDSPDPLVPADVNGVVDPYEWEAEGTGSCKSTEVSGGCLYLLSTGSSPDPSYLGDISTSGDDAFIFTSQPLVPTDKDALVDVYDARVGGGLASQHSGEGSPCIAEACKGASSSGPNGSLPGSASFNGPGNQATKKSAKSCQKKSKKKCKKAKKQKKSKHKKSRGAHTNRGGSK